MSTNVPAQLLKYNANPDQCLLVKVLWPLALWTMVAVSKGFMLLKYKLGLNLWFRSWGIWEKICFETYFKHYIHKVYFKIYYVWLILSEAVTAANPLSSLYWVVHRMRLLWCFTIFHFNVIKIFFVTINLKKRAPCTQRGLHFLHNFERIFRSSVVKSCGSAIFTFKKLGSL